MSFTNPYTGKINQINSDIRLWTATKIAEQKGIDWYKSFSLTYKQNELSDIQNELTNLERTIEENVGKIEILNKHSEHLKTKTASIWKLRTYFGKEQRQLRKKLQSVLDTVSLLRKANATHSEKTASLSKQVAELKKQLSDYSQFNLENSEIKLIEIEKTISQLHIQLQSTEAKSSALKSIIQKELNELGRLQKELENIKAEIKEAKYFESSLSKAENSYERAMAHQECEKKFGDSKPRRVITKKERQLSSVKRSISKIEERIATKIERHNRSIKKIIIDGNNFCYCGETFIGLSALISAVEILNNRYEVSVIFDAGIRGLMKTNDEKIRKQFATDVEVHVVATRETADETIIKYAGQTKTTYVLTNDRFVDFSSSSVVKDKRLLRHEILPNQVFIHDLNVDLTYEPMPN